MIDTTELRSQAFKAMNILAKADMRMTYVNVLCFTADGLGIEADEEDEYPEDYYRAFDKLWAALNKED